MNNRAMRSQLVLGLILIALGVWYIAMRNVPSLAHFSETYFKFPFNLMWIGAFLLAFGLYRGNAGLAVPAAIVAGVGGIFYYQQVSGQYDSWVYLWPLVLTSIGVGSVLQGLLGENTRRNVARGLNTIASSLVLFILFATFFGRVQLFGPYTAAIVLIGLGVWLLVRNMLRNRTGGTNA